MDVYYWVFVKLWKMVDGTQIYYDFYDSGLYIRLNHNHHKKSAFHLLTVVGAPTHKAALHTNNGGGAKSAFHLQFLKSLRYSSNPRSDFTPLFYREYIGLAGENFGGEDTMHLGIRIGAAI